MNSGHIEHHTRTKEEKLVDESQKFFIVLRVLGIIVALTLVVLVAVFVALSDDQEEASGDGSSSITTRTVTRTVTHPPPNPCGEPVEVIAMPGVQLEVLTPVKDCGVAFTKDPEYGNKNMRALLGIEQCGLRSQKLITGFKRDGTYLPGYLKEHDYCHLLWSAEAYPIYVIAKFYGR